MDEHSNAIRDYRDLVVWREAMDIAESVYSITRGFPREEMFGLTSQMRRSAVSIPANIAEGFGRARKQSFIQFLRIAQGSLKELETHVTLSVRVGFLDSQTAKPLEDQCVLLGKRLVTFVRSLEMGKQGR